MQKKGSEEQTAHHRCAEHDEMDCKLFMDFDMAVLGRPWPQYEEYSALVSLAHLEVLSEVYRSAGCPGFATHSNA